MNKFKKILIVFSWLLMLSGVFVILGFVNEEQKNLICKNLEIIIDGDTEHEFVDVEDILSIIRNTGDSIYGQSMATVNIGLLEKLIENNPSVSSAQVFKSVNGEIKVKVKQRNPLIRIFPISNDGFYIDEQGEFMPLSTKYSARVLMANGYVSAGFNTLGGTSIKEIIKDDSLSKRTILDELFIVADFINKNEFWKAQIQQIYVDHNNEIELIPRVGIHKIRIGNVTDLEEKFECLLIFYQQGLSKTGWNEYEIINLKYKNQIVCTKI